jgi:hypothetical protein
MRGISFQKCNCGTHPVLASAPQLLVFLVSVAKFAPGAYSGSMSSQRLEDLKTGLIKDFEAHKSHIPHQGLLRCSLCDMYQKELLRLEAAERGR